MDAPLHTECVALVARSIKPQTAVAFARRHNCERALTFAFPSMPSHLRIDVMTGKVTVDFVDGDWTLVREPQS